MNENEFKVICVNPKKSKLLFKDQIYVCNNVSKYTDEYRVNIKKIGRFDINQFTLLDGSDIPKIKSEPSNTYYYLRLNGQLSDLLGKSLICNTDRLKTLIKDKLYYISDVEYNPRSRDNSVSRIKVKGSSLWYSVYNFKELPTEVHRDLSIDSLIGDGGKLTELTTYERDNLTQMELLQKVLMSMVDAMQYINKLDFPNLSLYEVMKKRTFSRYGVSTDDFKVLDEIDWQNIINKKYIK